MGRTACTEPQCLYKGEIYLFNIFIHQILKKKQYCCSNDPSTPALMQHSDVISFQIPFKNVENFLE